MNANTTRTCLPQACGREPRRQHERQHNGLPDADEAPKLSTQPQRRHGQAPRKHPMRPVEGVHVPIAGRHGLEKNLAKKKRFGLLSQRSRSAVPRKGRAGAHKEGADAGSRTGSCHALSVSSGGQLRPPGFKRHHSFRVRLFLAAASPSLCGLTPSPAGEHRNAGRGRGAGSAAVRQHNDQ
jgi:hypothetical protein